MLESPSMPPEPPPSSAAASLSERPRTSLRADPRDFALLLLARLPAVPPLPRERERLPVAACITPHPEARGVPAGRVGSLHGRSCAPVRFPAVVGHSAGLVHRSQAETSIGRYARTVPKR